MVVVHHNHGGSSWLPPKSKLTGGLITESLIDGLYAYAGDTTGEPADKFVELGLDAYRDIIESVTGGMWRREFSEVIVVVGKDLPEDWQDTIGEQIGDLDLTPAFERATQPQDETP
jgi:hypothetical protein